MVKSHRNWAEIQTRLTLDTVKVAETERAVTVIGMNVVFAKIAYTKKSNVILPDVQQRVAVVVENNINILHLRTRQGQVQMTSMFSHAYGHATP